MRWMLLLTLALVLLAGCATREPEPAKPMPAPPDVASPEVAPKPAAPEVPEAPPAAAAPAIPNPDPHAAKGDFLDGHTGHRLTVHQLAALTAKADYILLGETHTNPLDHRMQARALQLMAAFGQNPVVGLEMVPFTMQAKLDRFNAGKVDHYDLEDLLDWQTTWGFDYGLYLPIFEVAHQEHLTLVGLNLPEELASRLGEVDLAGLTPQERELLPPRLIEPPAAQREMLQAAFAEHDFPDADQAEAQDHFDAFLRVQSAWDTTMAASAVRAHALYGRPVAILAGSGHVEQGWGIAYRIRSLDPNARIVTLMPWRGPDDPLAGADLFAFSPQTHRSSMGMTVEVDGSSVRVLEVDTKSRAARSGLRSGDVLVAACGAPVKRLMDLHTAGVSAHENGRPLILTVERKGHRVDVDLGLLGMRSE